MLQQVVRKDGVKEYFISKEFFQSEEWRKLDLDQSCYRELCKTYIKDYIKYNGEPFGQELTFPLKFTEIIHSTDQRALLSIIRDRGFRPGQKIIPDCTLDSFVWFGKKIGQAEVAACKDYYTLQGKMKKQDPFVDLGLLENLDETDCCSIVNSPCFEPMSRYGEFKLVFEFKNVIEAYRQQFCHKNQETNDLPKPELRILGTFVYKMETMHTVLVCAPNTPGTDKYPLLLSRKTRVIYEDPEKEGTFIWCPDSTGDKDNAAENQHERGPFRRWEHVTFAFHVPAGKILKLNNVSSNLSVCIHLNPFKKYEPSLIENTIQKFLDKVSEASTIESKRWFVNLLIRSLRGYLDEEKVFEKMNILYMYQSINLHTVVDRVEELLGGEDFDWSPLIEWMNDVQLTKNTAVLSSILKYLDKKREICITKLTSNGVPQ